MPQRSFGTSRDRERRVRSRMRIEGAIVRTGRSRPMPPAGVCAAWREPVGRPSQPSSGNGAPVAAAACAGDPSRIRTCNPRSRNPLLYPVELWDRQRPYTTANMKNPLRWQPVSGWNRPYDALSKRWNFLIRYSISEKRITSEASRCRAHRLLDRPEPGFARRTLIDTLGRSRHTCHQN